MPSAVICSTVFVTLAPFFHPLLSGKRRLAGCSDPLVSNFTHRRTRKRSLRHLQLIPPRFPPPLHPSAHPAISPQTEAQTSWWTGTLCVVAGWDAVRACDDVFAITDNDFDFLSGLWRPPYWTRARSLYSFHLVSMLPLCISRTLCVHTVGAQLAAKRPATCCKLKFSHTTSIRSIGREKFQMLSVFTNFYSYWSLPVRCPVTTKSLLSSSPNIVCPSCQSLTLEVNFDDVASNILYVMSLPFPRHTLKYI